MRAMVALAAVALAGCSTEPAASEKVPAGGHDASMAAMTPAPGDSAATRAYKQSMAGMMHGAPAYTGDADVDFMRQMRVHHVAAVEMAKAELAHGKDAEARQLAQAIVAAQQQEIGQIDRWLAAKAR